MSKGSTAVLSYRKRIKERAIAYKGGGCLVCGYKKCVRSLVFHHVDPHKKERGMGTGNTVAWDRLVIELEKCVLLCANCHGEVHEGLLDLTSHLFKNPTPEEGKKLLEEAEIPELRPTKPKLPPLLGQKEWVEPESWAQSHKCLDCQTPIFKTSSRCKPCSNRTRVKKSKIEWPSNENLIALVKKTNFVVAGKTLGVSDNAIRKRLRVRGLIEETRT